MFFIFIFLSVTISVLWVWYYSVWSKLIVVWLLDQGSMINMSNSAVTFSPKTLTVVSLTEFVLFIWCVCSCISVRQHQKIVEVGWELDFLWHILYAYVIGGYLSAVEWWGVSALGREINTWLKMIYIEGFREGIVEVAA